MGKDLCLEKSSVWSTLCERQQYSMLCSCLWYWNVFIQGKVKNLLLEKIWLSITNHLCLCLDYFRKEKPSLIFEILQRLSQLKRFDMAVMFMSGPERKSKFWESKLSCPSSPSSDLLLLAVYYVQDTHHQL